MLKYIALFVFFIALILGIKTYVTDIYTVISPSMLPTLTVGKSVWINKLNTTLNRNDIAAFYAPDGSLAPYVKRCVGVPSDTLTRLQDATFSLKNNTQNTDNQYFIIPRKGMKLTIDLQNLSFYKPLIEQQEGVQIGIVGTQLYINGAINDSYTFQQDYYFMVGDNRENSTDSRQWGLISEKAVLGKIF